MIAYNPMKEYEFIYLAEEIFFDPRKLVDLYRYIRGRTPEFLEMFLVQLRKASIRTYPEHLEALNVPEWRSGLVFQYPRTVRWRQKWTRADIEKYLLKPWGKQEQYQGLKMLTVKQIALILRALSITFMYYNMQKDAERDGLDPRAYLGNPEVWLDKYGGGDLE